MVLQDIVQHYGEYINNNDLDNKQTDRFTFPVCYYYYGTPHNIIIASFSPYMMKKYNITCTNVNIIGEGEKSISSQSLTANGLEIDCGGSSSYAGHLARCTFNFSLK